ncbi:unnamed protein product [Calypogeia fissa]
MTEAKLQTGQTGLLEAGGGGGDEDIKVAVVPAVAQQGGGVEGAEQPQQQRGVKRTRRDRGSTAKERISKMPPCAAGKRSSIYRGVTRHRWTGRYEAHLWDKSTWNQSQNKKGKQGAYDEEEAAARAYDLAALKYWGPGTLINFPLSDYARDTEEMQNVTREEYLAFLRRKSSGFSRGVSKYRGVARHHHNGRWEARIGRVFGNKYLYLGTYSTQEEAAAAYDMAAIEYRGLNAVTNFDLSRYIRWLRPGQSNSLLPETDATLSANPPTAGGDDSQLTGLTEDHQHGGAQQEDQQQHSNVWGVKSTNGGPYQSLPSLGLGQRSSSSPTALSLLLQSSMFKQMLERASATTVASPTECDIESSISSSYPSSEISLGVDHQQHQQQQQQHVLHSQQQSQDTSGYYSSWGKQTSHHQQSQLQAAPSPLDMQDAIENENPGSIHHRYRQQLLSMASSQHVHSVVGDQCYSDFQESKAHQNYGHAELQQQVQQQQQDQLSCVGPWLHTWPGTSVQFA